MKSRTGMERPSELIDKIEIGKGLTRAQCTVLWCWIEEIEDELLEARYYACAKKGIPISSIHESIPDDLYEG